MYTVKPTVKFQRDLKMAEKRGYKIDLLTVVIKKLAAGEPLDQSYNDHPMRGQYQGCLECHITLNLLLIYEIVDETLILYLTRTGTHADLFE
jgi:mRNA interferase YafQ